MLGYLKRVFEVGGQEGAGGQGDGWGGSAISSPAEGVFWNSRAGGGSNWDTGPEEGDGWGEDGWDSVQGSPPEKELSKRGDLKDDWERE
jgi:hypothetical protein